MNTKVAMSEDERSLLKLRDSMSDQQRSDMAEIIGNELKRRESLKAKSVTKSNVKASRLSGGLATDDLKDLYESTDRNIQELRVKSLERRVEDARREASRFGLKPASKSRQRSSAFPPSFSGFAGKMPVIFLAIGVVVFAGLKSLNAGPNTELKNAKVKTPSAQSEKSRAALAEPKSDTSFKEIDESNSKPPLSVSKNLTAELPTSEAERAVLMQLDQRRVELERRRLVLDQKEKELITQAKLVSEKVIELKSLTNKLAALRTEKDSKYDARLDQLASVYGAMAPNEASSLIAKLDEEVALGLLERMPEKRMAQILGAMEQARAIELTKLLTDRKML